MLGISSGYTDKKLIRMMNGDKTESDKAFRIIYDKYSSRVHAYCMRILNNREQTEDIFQETFLKFYKNATEDKLKSGSIAGFLITIARNLCLNYKRDKKSTVSYEEFHTMMTDNNDSDKEGKEEMYKLLTMAMDLINFELKEPLVLRLYDGLDYNEIARICDITPENARKRVFRAKQKIKEILEPYYKEING